MGGMIPKMRTLAEQIDDALGQGMWDDWRLDDGIWGLEGCTVPPLQEPAAEKKGRILEL